MIASLNLQFYKEYVSFFDTVSEAKAAINTEEKAVDFIKRWCQNQ